MTTSNLAECYNSIRTKYDGGKNKNRIMKSLFEVASICALLHFNEGPDWPVKFW